MMLGFCSVCIKHLLCESRDGLKMPEVHSHNASTITVCFKLPVENSNTQCSNLESPFGNGPFQKTAEP